MPLGGGQPVLWETLVFGGALDGEGGRYRTREEALAGHARILAEVRSTFVVELVIPVRVAIKVQPDGTRALHLIMHIGAPDLPQTDGRYDDFDAAVEAAVQGAVIPTLGGDEPTIVAKKE